MKLDNFMLILLGVILNTIAQICLKKGMLIIGSLSLDTNSMMMIPRIVVNIYIILGMLCYVLSFFVWLIVLSNIDVSLAYPMLSIGYIITALIGYYFMGEPLGIYKVLGIGTICIGTGLMFKS